jgi:hypothetical protein
MRHKKYIELINLSITGELSEKEISELNAHISLCPECKELLIATRKLKNIPLSDLHIEPPETLLEESRKELFAFINEPRSAKNPPRAEKIGKIHIPANLVKFPAIASILSFGKNILNKKTAISFALVFLFGIFSGFLLFKYAFNDNISKGIISENMTIAGKPVIQNLRFISNENETGKVEFTIDEVIKMKVTGNINEPQVQNILARALVNEQNPGIKLKTISAFNENKLTGKPMKDAIIQTLKHDDNPGVRAEALNVLSDMPYDNEIEESIIFVLQNDQNSGIRINALKIIEKYQTREKISDGRLCNILKVKSETDENSFVRYKAASLIEEIKK